MTARTSLQTEDRRQSAVTRITPTPSAWYSGTLLILILAAFALRLYRLDAQSLWYDEGVTAMVAQFAPADLIRWTADDIQPPLYYLVVAGWGRLAGWSEWSLRFPSAFFGALTVPLLAALAVRLARSRAAGALAGLITALHPLLIYYSQEARMYALLVALGVVIAYCVLRAQRAPAHCVDKWQRWLFWTGYVLTATAALYTHYFAFFLLLALGVALVLEQIFASSPLRLFASSLHFHAAPPRRRASHIFPFLAANLTVLLLYAPWLRILFTQLDVDTSYWEGTLKVWEALRHVAIRFSVGETVLEAEAVQWLWIYGAVTLLALGMLSMVGRRTEDRRPTTDDRTTHHPPLIIHYSLFITLLPIVGILALASITPKFNPRYVMVALPGLILLWSGGLARGLETGDRRQGTGDWGSGLDDRTTHHALRFTALAGLVALLAGFLYADANWFTDPAFTKDQWRELAAHVKTHRRPDEAVVLVSGHAAPIWAYYAPEIEPIRLPDIEILDVNAVLDFENTADALRIGLTDSTGAWLVDWQDAVVDPMGVVPLQLERAGEEIAVDAGFWGLALRRFDLTDVTQISADPPIRQRVDVNFGNVVHLLGFSITDSGDLLLFWRLDPEYAIRKTQHPDLHLTGETRTADGLLYAEIEDRRLSAYTYPTFRWQPGQVTVGRIPAAEWIGSGAPAGNYRVLLGVTDPASDPVGLDVLDETGNPLGKRVPVDVTLAEPISFSLDGPPADWHEITDDLFVQPTLAAEEAEPGQPVRLEMRWYASTPVAVQALVINWNERGRAIQWPGNRMPVRLDLRGEKAVRTVHAIHPPVDLPPGDYRLELTVDRMPMTPLTIPFTVLPSSRTFDLPDLGQPVDAEFGAVVELAGLDAPISAQITPGDTVPITLIWQALATTQTDYSVTVQFLNEAGQPVHQVDAELPKGTSTWLAGEVVTQSLVLTAPEEPGRYRLIAAVYDAAVSGFPRLLLPNGTDAVSLAEVEVE